MTPSSQIPPMEHGPGKCVNLQQLEACRENYARLIEDYGRLVANNVWFSRRLKVIEERVRELDPDWYEANRGAEQQAVEDAVLAAASRRTLLGDTP